MLFTKLPTLSCPKAAQRRAISGKLIRVGGVALALGLVMVLASLVDAPSAGARVNPRTAIGSMDSATVEPGAIRVTGWASDPDTKKPINVVVAVDTSLVLRSARLPRPDLGRGALRGFDISVPVGPGQHTMCVAAMNVGKGDRFRLLGCKQFTIGNVNPIGSLDVVRLISGTTLELQGWALDPETPFPTPVHVTVDGQQKARLVAADDRSDIGQLFPALGSRHGFFGQIPLTPGTHSVCLTVQNIGAGSDQSLGCPTVSVAPIDPVGSLDGVTVGVNQIQVQGWALDPDSTASSRIAISQWDPTGVNDAIVVSAVADQQRPDVGAALNTDPRRGFSVSLPVLEAGQRTVCVTVINVGLGADRQIGCTTVNIADRRPQVQIDAVRPVPGGVQLSGWAFDQESSSSVTLTLTVDGAPRTFSATLSRPDVGAAYPGAGSNRGFNHTIGSLSNGLHQLCLTAANQGGAPGLNADRRLPCSTVVLGSPAVGTTGALTSSTPVSPDVGSSLHLIDRDGGISARLRDGTLLWLFGDSAELDAFGGFKYFVSGTAALASPSAPTVTRDALASNGEPYLAAVPDPNLVCPSNMAHKALWPLSASVVPAGTNDRVVVYLASMCLGTIGNYSYRGMAVGEFIYTPGFDYSNQPITLTMLNYSLTQSHQFGEAAHYDSASDRIYAYACDQPANPLLVGSFGPCYLSRVAPASAADPNAYQYWNGSGWVASAAAATPLTLPPGRETGTRYPASAFTVNFDPSHGLYTMVYSPWPGFTNQATVRVSKTITGPWSEPVSIELPNCLNTVAGKAMNCYAVTAQPWLSTSTSLGLGYYDQAVSTGPTRGRYQVGSVPWSTVLNP